MKYLKSRRRADGGRAASQRSFRRKEMIKPYAAIMFLSAIYLSGCATPEDSADDSDDAYDPAFSLDSAPGAVLKLQQEADRKLRAAIRKANKMVFIKEFDPNRYFKVLTHLSMSDDHVLDYVQDYEGIEMPPTLYARKKTDKPFETYQDFETSCGGREAAREKRDEYLNFVKTDGTEDGFIELAILDLMGKHFYHLAGERISSHSTDNNRLAVTSKKDIDAIIDLVNSPKQNKYQFFRKFSEDKMRDARAIDPKPIVKPAGDDRLEISIVIFDIWHGFMRTTHIVRRSFPHWLKSESVHFLRLVPIV
jgi:hypothetical protein